MRFVSKSIAVWLLAIGIVFVILPSLQSVWTNIKNKSTPATSEYSGYLATALLLIGFFGVGGFKGLKG